MNRINDVIAGLPIKTLSSGAHPAGSGKMCINEAVAFLSGENHSDRPECMCPVIARFTLNWNDNLIRDAERLKWLGPLMLDVLDTSGSYQLAERRSWMAFDWMVRTHTVAWLRLDRSLQAHADALAKLPVIGTSAALRESEPAVDAARVAARDAVGAAMKAAGHCARWTDAEDAAQAAAGTTAGAAAWSAAKAAGWAVTGAAIGEAAQVAAGAAARAAAWGAARVDLEPTTLDLQTSAQDLLRRMCALSDETVSTAHKKRLVHN